MAKKPQKKEQQPRGRNLKGFIRKFISNEGSLKADLTDPKFEFGFNFLHPKGKAPNGKPLGRTFLIIKPKKKNFLELSTSTTISLEHVQILESKSKKDDFLNNVAKLLLLKNTDYRILRERNQYIIMQRIYLNEKKEITEDILYATMRKLYALDVYIVLIIQEICSGKLDPSDIPSGPDFYT